MKPHRITMAMDATSVDRPFDEIDKARDPGLPVAVSNKGVTSTTRAAEWP
jgi:hypothetical protein